MFTFFMVTHALFWKISSLFVCQGESRVEVSCAACKPEPPVVGSVNTTCTGIVHTIIHSGFFKSR